MHSPVVFQSNPLRYGAFQNNNQPDVEIIRSQLKYFNLTVIADPSDEGVANDIMSHVLRSLNASDPLLAKLAALDCGHNSEWAYIDKIIHTGTMYVLEAAVQGGMRYLRVKPSLNRLLGILNEPTKLVFSPIIEIEKMGDIDNQSPVTSGDIDGSTARNTLLAEKLGFIDLCERKIMMLAYLMKEEASLLNFLNEKYDQLIDDNTDYTTLSAEELGRVTLKKVIAYQSNKALQHTLECLAQGLEFHPPTTGLLYICLGDCAHDRFSINKNVDRFIREGMKKCGAIFITGNHDVFFKKFGDLEKKEDIVGVIQQGAWAKDNAEPGDWLEHQKRVLTNAYFDEHTHTLFIHHGFDWHLQGNCAYVRTAFGVYPVPLVIDNQLNPNFTVKEFVSWINAQPLPKPDALCSFWEKAMNEQYFAFFTNYKPLEQHVQEIAGLLNIRVVHGHNGAKNTALGNVIVLNARFWEEGMPEGTYGYSPVAAQIGPYIPN